MPSRRSTTATVGPPSRSPTGRLGDRNVAEDITQEAFLFIRRSRVRFDRERGSVRAWVLGIVHHRTIDALRKNTSHDRHRASAEGPRGAPGGAGARAHRRRGRPLQAGPRGPRRARHAARVQLQVVRLAYFGGFTHTQIAQMLDMPICTVKGPDGASASKKTRRALGSRRSRGRYECRARPTSAMPTTPRRAYPHPAVDEGEERAFEVDLDTCPVCQDELDRLSLAVDFCRAFVGRPVRAATGAPRVCS